MTTLAERIEYVGRALYGRIWTVKMARELGISRSQLFEYRRAFGGKTDGARDLDGEIVALIGREPVLSQERSASLVVVRIVVERSAGLSRKKAKKEVDRAAA